MSKLASAGGLEKVVLMTEDSPLSSVTEEAVRLLANAGKDGVVARLIGGVAVACHQHTEVPTSLVRSYGDIDLVVRGKDGVKFNNVMLKSGYVANQRFNSLHGDRRLLYYDEVNGRQVDVFVDTFNMCHSLKLTDRLEIHAMTLSPADLLLTKLQIVEMNRKDLVDAVTLLRDHDVASERLGDVIGVDRITAVLSEDWGFFTTVFDSLDKTSAAAPALLSESDVVVVSSRIDSLRIAITEAPKSMRWRARARIGRRMVWYELPEEVGGG